MTRYVNMPETAYRNCMWRNLKLNVRSNIPEVHTRYNGGAYRNGTGSRKWSRIPIFPLLWSAILIIDAGVCTVHSPSLCSSRVQYTFVVVHLWQGTCWYDMILMCIRVWPRSQSGTVLPTLEIGNVFAVGMYISSLDELSDTPCMKQLLYEQCWMRF